MSAREKTFREELDKLIEEGEILYQAIQEEHKTVDTCFQETFFRQHYQQWYSKADIVIKAILPSRYDEFISCYKYQDTRDRLRPSNYRIQDYLHNKLFIKDTSNLVFGASTYSQTKKEFPTVSPYFYQQLYILKSAKEILSSTLFNLKALVQADLFDSEIDVAKELAKKGFFRAAGAICGVVIEKHLLTLCQNHQIKIGKKHPTINDLCEPLKKEEIISQPDWRLILFYADIRNLCCHNKEHEPTKEQVADLIYGTDKIIKTIS